MRDITCKDCDYILQSYNEFKYSVVKYGQGFVLRDAEKERGQRCTGSMPCCCASTLYFSQNGMAGAKVASSTYSDTRSALVGLKTPN